MAGVRGSRTHPRTGCRPRNGFEDRGTHRDPSTPNVEIRTPDGLNATLRPAPLPGRPDRYRRIAGTVRTYLAALALPAFAFPTLAFWPPSAATDCR